MNDKTIFAIFVICVAALLQVVAWLMGFNGTVFAFTSLIIGLASGAMLGFKFSR